MTGLQSSADGAQVEGTASGLPEEYDLVMSMGTETSSTYAMGIQIGEYINTLAPNITCTVKAGAGCIESGASQQQSGGNWTLQ